jgi:enoyl-CoA hydratase/carnithine racemase
MGLDRALKMTLLHEVYDAPTAHASGLVTEVVADDALDGRALELATALATKAPLAVRLAKTMMAAASTLSLADSLIDAQLAVNIANPSADVREGVAAFKAKRPPRFEGR